MILNILKKVLLGSGKGSLEYEIKPLRESIATEELIPWSADELTLLSLQLDHKSKSSFFNSLVTGSFKTIYAESIIGYAYQDVYTGTKKGLILAKSKTHEYAYRLRNGVAQVYINGNAIGIIDYQGRLISRRKKVIAMIDQSSSNIQEITVEGVKIGSLNKPTKDAALHQRAVQLFKESSNKGQQFLVSLVIFEILKRNV